MRTIIYVDAFNLYYGCLRGTPYKWLDLNKLFAHYFPSDEYDIEKIKYFTAHVKKNPHDTSVQQRQNYYLNALDATGIEVIKGHYSRRKEFKWTAETSPSRVKVIIDEEKGSDVNLATEMLNDAWLNKYDCAALVSNDSDMAKSVELIQEYHPEKKLWLVTPAYNDRSASKKLSKLVGSYKKRIDSGKILEKCQLPNPVIDKETGRKITKPTKW